MMQELISVIVPVYKVEAYLERCVYSIIAQTYRDLEIILVDDGSPDTCGEICDRLAKEDSRIRVFHKQNGGLSDARNYGVDRSTGKYICFVDSDDYIAANHVEYLWKLLKKADADTACCWMIRTDSDNVQFCEKEGFPTELVITGKEACKGLFEDLYTVLVTACGKLYTSEIVKKYPFPVGKKHEDEATTCKYYYASKKVVVGNQCLYAYYQNTQSIMNTLSAALNKDAIWALEHRARFFEEQNEKKLAKCAWRVLYYYYLNDSRDYNGRCDPFLAELDVRKLPFKNMVSLSLKRYIPKPYSYYRKAKEAVGNLFSKK